MKKNAVLKMAAAVVLTAGLLIRDVTAQTEVAVEKNATLQPIASEVLAKILAEADKGLIPLAMYPTGYLEWLKAQGDNVLSVSDEITSEKSKRSPQAPRPLNDQITEDRDYYVIDLGTFGGNASYAYGINEPGDVVGEASISGGNSRAFLYIGSSMVNLGTLGGDLSVANGINDGGQVVGWALTSDNVERAFKYTDNSMVNLGTLGGTYSEAFGINNDGDVVGFSSLIGDPYLAWHAFLYSGSSMQDVGSLGGEPIAAYGINDSGQVVGSSYFTNGVLQHPFLYSSGSMKDISTLAGIFIWSGEARGINGKGEVVGYYSTNSVNVSAFRYSGGSLENLGTLGGNGSYAYGINAHGLTVGSSYTSGNASFHAFLYSNGSMKDLNDFVVPSSSGWRLAEARGINSAGEIVGWGINPSGQTRAFLLIPLPLGWREAIETDPSRKTYGIPPTKESGKDSLIVVTHGWNPDLAWLHAMTNNIKQYLTAHDLNTWQVYEYEWLAGAQFNIGPQAALENAAQDGYKLGKYIATNSWTHVHLIGHSAGAGLIHAVSEVIRTNSTGITVHCTFLDPFVGVRFEGASAYGKYADWADNYFSHDWETLGNVYPVTEKPLLHAYNVNVTQLNKTRDVGAFVSLGNGVAEPCYRTGTSHEWPIAFYSNTITGTVSSEYEGFGFPLSKEGGNWDSATNNYVAGNIPSRVLGTPDQDCVSFASVDPQTMLNVAVSQSQAYQSGDITKYANGLKAITHSPSWLAMVVAVTNPVSFVSFDARFTSINGSEGLLSAFWDADTLGSIDETAVQSGLQHYTFTFPNANANSIHMLGFRLDPFTNVQSSVIVTNIVLGLAGPSQPFRLSITTNTIGSLRVFELNGQAGFNYTVQASTNLVNWETIAVLINTNGAVRFFDQSSTNFSQRFYRAVAAH